jgi:hypothetical protein
MTKSRIDAVEPASESIGTGSGANTASETKPPLLPGDRVRISAPG